jgi:hypothetical protein
LATTLPFSFLSSQSGIVRLLPEIRGNASWKRNLAQLLRVARDHGYGCFSTGEQLLQPSQLRSWLTDPAFP